MQQISEDGNREQRVLVLQGGGALGAYQAGAYEALAESGYSPHWVAGISIGAVNGAIIAGNKPENRVKRLRQFWELVSSGLQGLPLNGNHHVRNIFNDTSSLLSLICGVPGFFSPRLAPPIFAHADRTDRLGYYDTGQLRDTLGKLVEFPLTKGNKVRLSIGAVNVESGNFAYFDSEKKNLGPEHIMASGALPPGLPPIKIENDFYWDGGLVSNTPLQYVLDEPGHASRLCVFQIDLFSARGVLPETLLDAVEREKEIRFSSRTRLNTDMMRDKVAAKHALGRLLRKLPEEWRNDPDARFLMRQDEEPDVSIVHLIYRAKAYESHARDYEFSRVSVEEHWEQGRKDVLATFGKKAWQERRPAPAGVQVFDLAHSD